MNHANELSVSWKTANFHCSVGLPSFERVYSFRWTESFGTSTVVETKNAPHVRIDIGSENVGLSWTPRHHFAMRSRNITQQVGRKCEIQTSRNPGLSQTDLNKPSEHWKIISNSCRNKCARCWQQCKTARNTDRLMTVR